MNSRMEQACYKILLNTGVVAKKDLDRIYNESEHSEATFSQMVVKSGLVKETDLLDIYSKSLGVPRVGLKDFQGGEKVLASVPIKFAGYYKFVPIRFEGRKLLIAVANLLDVNTLDDIRMSLGFEVGIALATQAEIDEMLKKYYGLGAGTVDKILNQTTPARESSGSPLPRSGTSVQETFVENIERSDETASVTSLVNQILLDAYKRRASDIHIEPYRDRVRIRYRIDGVLQEAPIPPHINKFFQPILSRIKVMANLNTVEKRLPQDGRARVKTHAQELDLRISSIPTPMGESMVIRILPTQMDYMMDKLGFEPPHFKMMTSLVAQPHGIIFVTGPTGSGKTTTLYAALNSINTVARKVITIEDPIEYELEGITQIQVMPQLGLTFAAGLRSVLRHDPDVMMVGEVRDLETADIAIRIALTGHLILSTLHTNDAASGVTRLLDIGVEPYLIASSVLAFVAQRLVRVVCPQCKYVDADGFARHKQLIMRDLELPTMEDIKIYAGKGCDHCQGSGYVGRIAIHEIMLVNDDMRSMIRRKASPDELKKAMRAMGMSTLRQDGWKKVIRGLTTPSEVLEASPEDIPVDPEEAALPSNKPVKIPAAFLPKANSQANADKLKEKRKYDRRKITVPVKFRVLDPKQEDEVSPETIPLNCEGESENIGAGGTCFLTQTYAKTGDILEVSVAMPDNDPPIRCLARALRVQELGDAEKREMRMAYRIAVAFLAISSTDRLRMENFCAGEKANETV